MHRVVYYDARPLHRETSRTARGIDRLWQPIPRERRHRLVLSRRHSRSQL